MSLVQRSGLVFPESVIGNPVRGETNGCCIRASAGMMAKRANSALWTRFKLHNYTICGAIKEYHMVDYCNWMAVTSTGLDSGVAQGKGDPPSRYIHFQHPHLNLLPNLDHFPRILDIAVG